jgi:hypothetical protein
MLIVLGVVLALLVAGWLVRRALRARRSGNRGVIPAVLAAIAVLALAALAATGRLHWLAAAGAALLPVLRRLMGLLRFLPVIGRVLGDLRRPGSASGSQADGAASGDRRRTGEFSPAGRGGMTRDDALALLGLPRDASREAIVDAHRRLMQRVHPDRGGSVALAQQLNEARRVLLDEWVA